MNKKEQQFVATVLDYYHAHGRGTLPWRKTTKPYRILVSEIMLQQTQVDRVIPKYNFFIKRWPTVQKLAEASLGEVLSEWQGLGYNRRAKFLHECAKTVVTEHNGVFPKTYKGLQELPGIGPYTAGAVMAFAYNQSVPIIETNIRTVILYHFFKGKRDVTEAQIMEKVERTLPQRDARIWYAALMDYGTYLKQTVGNLNTKSKSYTKQSKFKGSDREIRGAILRALASGSLTFIQLKQELSEFDADRLVEQLTKLQSEEMVVKEGRRVSLP